MRCSSGHWGNSPVPDKFVDLFSWRRRCLVAAAPQPRRGNHRHWRSSAAAVATVVTTTIATTLARFFAEGPAKAHSPVTAWGPLFWGLEKGRNTSSIKSSWKSFPILTTKFSLHLLRNYTYLHNRSSLFQIMHWVSRKNKLNKILDTIGTTVSQRRRILTWS